MSTDSALSAPVYHDHHAAAHGIHAGLHMKCVQSARYSYSLYMSCMHTCHVCIVHCGSESEIVHCCIVRVRVRVRATHHIHAQLNNTGSMIKLYRSTLYKIQAHSHAAYSTQHKLTGSLTLQHCAVCEVWGSVK